MPVQSNVVDARLAPRFFDIIDLHWVAHAQSFCGMKDQGRKEREPGSASPCV